MTSVLHPVGPEPEQTYWVRRALVLASAVLLVALVIALVVGGSSTGNAVSADPAPPPVSAPAPVTPTPSAFVTPTPTPDPTASPTPSGSSSASESAAAPASPGAAASASATPSPSAEAEAEADTKAKAKPRKAAPVACDPGDLRATLTGKRQLKPEQASTFDLSLINGSGATCVVDVDAESFELKIYSGTDRIWSTADCAGAVKPITKTVKAEDAVEWSMHWDGRRSRAGCKDRPEIPQPGTYFATAQLDGAKPVQLRMILRG